jgi:4-diphosphocytidyl-2-C-methyl-D-erythritol kinase
LANHAGGLPDLEVHLEKHIPHGAGLGGGSSDAACVLKALNAYAAHPLEFSALAALAGQIGSDVPFFLHGMVCDATDRGEVIQPRPEILLDWPILLVKPPFGVPTPWAYQHWLTSEKLPGYDYGPNTLESHILVNDLERPVFQKHLVLATLRETLQSAPGVRASRMSGSGSTIFAVLESNYNETLLREIVAETLGAEAWVCFTRCA